MKSMTGYGYSEYSCDSYVLTVELKAYNNKYLEVNYSSPSVFSSYESQVNEIVKNYANRGHIDLSIRLKILKGKVEISIDESLADAYIKAQKTVSDLMTKEGLPVGKSKPADIMGFDGVMTSVREDTLETYREGLEKCMGDVMQMFSDAKEREGLATRKDLENKINSFESSLSVIKKNASKLETQIKQNLMDRIHEMQIDTSYDESRILTEVAVMLMRYTINEETVRLDTHIAEFRRLLTLDEPTGKKLDFLCQEMNREVNTIGSKSQMVEINLEVVNMKDCLENIREQIRNIE